MNLKHYIIMPILALLTGCMSNPYTKFYTDYTNGADVLTDERFEQQTAPPQLFTGTSIEEDEKIMIRRGYTCLGIASFNGATVSDTQALAQAKKVFADVVITYLDYTDTVSGSMPLTLPDTQTSTTHMSGSIYGSGGGYANYSGTANTTTYGTSTTYIPYNVRRYDYLACFWKKMKPLSFGVLYFDLSTESKSALESNKGVEIRIVVENSPAFNEDILEGDIILEINGERVKNAVHASSLLTESKGKKTAFKLFRKGKIIEKEIVLND